MASSSNAAVGLASGSARSRRPENRTARRRPRYPDDDPSRSRLSSANGPEVDSSLLEFNRQGSRRTTTRGAPEAAFDVDGAATSNPARSNIAAVPV